MGNVLNIEEKKIISWLKNPYNLILAGIIILGIVLRIFYFSLTSDQPLWWDESDYMAYAKNLAGFEGDWIITSQHNSLFSFLAAGLFKIGLMESSIKFLLVVIPSILLIVLVYMTCLQMYSDKKIALSCSFITAIFWAILFNSTRFHVGIPALFFIFLGLYVFWKGHENKESFFLKIKSKWAVPVSAIFIVLAYSTRRAYALFGIFLLIYVFLTKNPRELIKDKYNWIGVGIAIFLLVIVESFIFISPVTNVASSYYHPEDSLNFAHLHVFESFFQSFSQIPSILLYLFYLGLIFLIVNFFISVGYIRKSKDNSLRSDLFALISIFVTLIYFIFYQRGTGFGEPRWYFSLLFASFICISRAGVFLHNFLKKHSKYLAIIILLSLFFIGGVYQVSHATEIIKIKKDTYSGIRGASLFIKDVSFPEDIIISQPLPQTIYYSERRAIQPEQVIGKTSAEETSFDEFMQELSSNSSYRYLIITFSEPGYPDWMAYRTQNQIFVPFMETYADFQTNQQDIKQSKSFEEYGLQINLLQIVEDAFVYEVKRTN